MADRIGVMANGRLIADGTLDELRRHDRAPADASLEDTFLALVAQSRSRGMSEPGTIAGSPAHEARLAWRDWLSLMTRGPPRARARVRSGFIAFACSCSLAYLIVAGSPTSRHGRHARARGDHRHAGAGLVVDAVAGDGVGDARILRARRSRADPDLSGDDVAAVRRAHLRDGGRRSCDGAGARRAVHQRAGLARRRALARRLSVVVALGDGRGRVAVVLTVALFASSAPRRTRVIAQIVAAVIGAAFAIGLQFAAIVSFGTMSVRALQSRAGSGRARRRTASFWWPARAVLGEPAALAFLDRPRRARPAAISTFSRRASAGSRWPPAACRMARATAPRRLALPRRVARAGAAAQGVDAAACAIPG